MRTLLLLISSTAVLSAAPIFQTTCSMQGAATVTGTSSCSVQVNPDYRSIGISTANAALMFMTASDPAQYSSLSLHLDAATSPYVKPLPYFSLGEGSASAEIQFETGLTTAGPLRPGYLQAVASINGWFDQNGRIDANVGIPGSTQFTGARSYLAFCATPASPRSCGFHSEPHYFPNPVPVNLGIPFTFVANAYLASYASDNPPDSAFLDASYQFRFFEADGSTAVATTETPEPSS